MNDETSPLRDRTNRLILRLAEAFGADPDAHAGAIRHLGIAALNLSRDADAATVEAASRALPWVDVLASWEDGDYSGADVAAVIEERGLIRHLGTETVRRHLDNNACGDQSMIRRAPESCETKGRVEILAELAARDRGVERLLAADDDERPDILVADSRLFATVLSAQVAPRHSGIAEALAGLLPDWQLSPVPRPLEILARFEERHFETVPGEFGGLGERARRFEKSLATHLQSHELMPTLRAALAISPTADADPVPNDKVRRYLARFSVFASDPTLMELTLALITMRCRVVDHVRGRLPFGALTPWVTYLRGPCAEFAERRGITLREATNFAHYALHLLDLCELAADGGVALRDPVRRAVMDIEDELKEFALVGQRTGLSDEQSDLGRYDDNRWRSRGLRTRIADRLARICGAWRSGHRSGPPGTPPRPDDELYDRCLELVEDEEDSDLDALANLLGRARLRGLEGLDGWAPNDILALIDPVLRSAAHASTLDVSRDFSVDFSELTTWLAADGGGRRDDILHTLLELEVSASKLYECSAGLSVEPGDQRLLVRFVSTDEFDALLTLLSSPSADDAAFAASLRQRLLDCLQATAPPSSPDSSVNVHAGYRAPST